MLLKKKNKEWLKEQEILDELEKRDIINPEPDLFKDFSDEQLEKELEKRKKPKILNSEDINLSGLRKKAEEYVDSLFKNGHPPKDAEQYMFEEVMRTFYGKDIFLWINNEYIEF